MENSANVWYVNMFINRQNIEENGKKIRKQFEMNQNTIYQNL